MDNDFSHSDHGYLSGAVLCYLGSHALGKSRLGAARAVNVRPPCYDHLMMIAYSNDEQYMSIVQAMIDLDFNDTLDPSRFQRIRGMVPPGPWEVA